MRHLARAMWIAGLAAVILMPSGVVAQTGTHGDFEISVLNGIGLLTSGGGQTSVIMTPVPPVWRVTYWTPSPVTANLGFSILASDGLTVVNGEMGLGVNFARRGAKNVPFVGVLGGLLLTDDESFTDREYYDDDNADTNFYIGGQAGIRTFIRDYAAVRFQTGYRRVMLERDDVGIIEFVGGLSFFL